MTILNAHALVVGIAAYHSLPRLPVPVLSDARTVNEVLVDPQWCNYPVGNVCCLLDAQATHDAILEGLRKLANRADEDSTALIYFAGYGGHAAQGPLAGNYLMPVDARWKNDAQAFESVITGAEFIEALHFIQARKLILMLDCCHPGGTGQLNDALPLLTTGLSEEYLTHLQKGSDRAVLACLPEGEPSWLAADAPKSVFTHYLLDGLRGGAAGRDGYVRILDLYNYVYPRVQDVQPHQCPLLKNEAGNNFVIAVGRGGAKQAPLPDSQGFRYDAYLCFADANPDRQVMESKVIPRLRDAGLRLAVRYEVEEVGTIQIVEVERVIEESKYTVMFMSPAYFEDPIAEFANVLVQTLELSEGRVRLKAVMFGPMGSKKIPSRLKIYVSRNLTILERFELEINLLIEGLRRPLPER